MDQTRKSNNGHQKNVIIAMMTTSAFAIKTFFDVFFVVSFTEAYDAPWAA